mmetsp:Transcript_55182/g.117294  ORF Transcript_55182/g.117294 Transcript_55182/m.117294 type:complete len:197 (+) Transcript_55182:675-1265(+)
MVQCLPRPAQRSASQTSLITQLYIRMMRATSPELSEMGLLSVALHQTRPVDETIPFSPAGRRGGPPGRKLDTLRPHQPRHLQRLPARRGGRRLRTAPSSAWAWTMSTRRRSTRRAARRREGGGGTSGETARPALNEPSDVGEFSNRASISAMGTGSADEANCTNRRIPRNNSGRSNARSHVSGCQRSVDDARSQQG